MSNVDKALAQLVEKATSLGENVVDFCRAQAPELVNQFLHWKFVVSMAWTVGLGIAMVVGALLTLLALYGGKSKEVDEEIAMSFVLIGIGIVVVCVIPFLVALFTCIKIKCFSDLYLFDALMDLVRTMK